MNNAQERARGDAQKQSKNLNAHFAKNNHLTTFEMHKDFLLILHKNEDNLIFLISINICCIYILKNWVYLKIQDFVNNLIKAN